MLSDGKSLGAPIITTAESMLFAGKEKESATAANQALVIAKRGGRAEQALEKLNLILSPALPDVACLSIAEHYGTIAPDSERPDTELYRRVGA